MLRGYCVVGVRTDYSIEKVPLEPFFFFSLGWTLKLFAGDLANRASISGSFNQGRLRCVAFVQLSVPDPVLSFSVHLSNTFLEQIHHAF